MKKAFSVFLMVRMLLILAAAPVFAGPAEDLFSLDRQMMMGSDRDLNAASHAQNSLSDQETRLSDQLLNAPGDLQDVANRSADLSPELRDRLVKRIRFAIVQENRQDLIPALALFQKADPARGGALSRDNLLGIPMRTGSLELSALLQKRRGQILECSKTRFVAVLDTFRVEVTPDPANPKKVLAKITGSAQAPQQPVGAVVTTDGTTAHVIGDDGSTLQATYRSDGTYKFASNKLPVSVSAKYID